MKNLLSVIICILSFSIFVLSLQIELDPTEASKPKCIGQELDQEDSATFRISAPQPNKSKQQNELIAKVLDPDGSELFSDKIVIGGSPREFRKNIEVRGVYEICLQLHGGTSLVRADIDVEYKSRNGRGKSDPSKRIDKEDIPTLEDQLKAAEDALADIGREIDFARRQESLLREAGESAQSRIEWFSILSIAILLTTSLWQLIYLRKFFSSKKLL